MAGGYMKGVESLPEDIYSRQPAYRAGVMQRPTAFECRDCGHWVDAPASHLCGADDSGFQLVHDHDEIRERFDPGRPVTDLWQYEPLLPVSGEEAVSLGAGGTPLLEAPTLGESLGVSLALKREGSNPTGSTKDRGTTTLVTHAREAGAAAVSCASTGNAAASLAAYAARASLPAKLFVPEDLSGGKAVQPDVYGADVTHVEGSYHDAHERCQRASADRAWVDRSAGASPYTGAGARTLGYEIVEQHPSVPDWVVVPMGNGGTLADVYRGLRTFAALDFTAKAPGILGVQSATNCPIHDALDGGERRSGTTMADSIDVESPRRAEDAKRAIRDSEGTSVAVTEEEMRAALRDLGKAEGVFAEPASATTIAAIDKARESGIVDRGDRVVAVVTGTGLKDLDAGWRAVDETP